MLHRGQEGTDSSLLKFAKQVQEYIISIQSYCCTAVDYDNMRTKTVNTTSTKQLHAPLGRGTK